MPELPVPGVIPRLSAVVKGDPSVSVRVWTIATLGRHASELDSKIVRDVLSKGLRSPEVSVRRIASKLLKERKNISDQVYPLLMKRLLVVDDAQVCENLLYCLERRKDKRIVGALLSLATRRK